MDLITYDQTMKIIESLDYIIDLMFLDVNFIHVQIPMPQIIIDVTVSLVRFVVNVYLWLVGFGFLLAFLTGIVLGIINFF